MLTQEQEQFLATFADKGLAEQRATQDRQAALDLQMQIETARQTKLAELQAKQEVELTAAMAEFEATVVPTITTITSLQ